MPEILTIGERRISGTGLILPSFADLKHRRYTLFADIIRKPKTPYLSTESEPPETYYGIISLMYNDYVLQTYPIKYDAQVWIFDADISGQALIAIKCQYLGILESFANLGTALGLTVTSVTNTIGDYRNLPLQWNSINIKCFADCAIQFSLKALTYDSCNPDYQDPAIAAQPPEKPSIVQPGIATDISDPYPGDTITSPAPIDLTFVSPPTGNDCQAYVVVIQYDRLDSSQNPRTTTVGAYGPIGQVSVSSDGSVILLENKGNPAIEACGVFTARGVFSAGAGQLGNVSILSIT